MTTMQRSRITFTPEGGGWLAVRRNEPGLAKASAVEMLFRARELPGNLRYLRIGRSVVIHGELSNAAGDTEAEDRLAAWLDGGTGETAAPADETIEAALTAAGIACTRREKSWAVPAGEQFLREVQISAAPGVVTVETTLADWDEIGPEQKDALARFLLAAQAGLRWARCDLGEHGARLRAVVDGDRVDADLVHAVLGVAAGCRRLARDAAALLQPDAACAYLEFHAER